MTDWLYPLNQTTVPWTTGGAAATPSHFLALVRHGDHSVFFLNANWHNVDPGDRIWFYFSAPEKVVMAVGIVQTVYETTDLTSWRVVIEHHQAATELLMVSPVALAWHPHRPVERASDANRAALYMSPAARLLDQ